jgi:predicted HTH domain antitoxin
MARRSSLALEEELAVVTETGACGLYQKGLFSLGKAAEWSGLSTEEIKESLHRRGIVRQSTADLSEIEAMAKDSLEAARRPLDKIKFAVPPQENQVGEGLPHRRELLAEGSSLFS